MGGGGSYKLKHQKKKLLAEYRVMLKGYYRPVALLLIYSFIASMLSFVMPIALKVLLDDVATGGSLRTSAMVKFVPWLRAYLPDQSRSSLVFVVWVLISAALISIALDWLRLLAQQRVNYRMAGSLRVRLHKHLSKLSLAQLSDYKTGGVVSRIMADTDQVVGGVQNAIVNPVNALMRITLTIFLIVFTDWRLSLAAAVLIPPS